MRAETEPWWRQARADSQVSITPALHSFAEALCETVGATRVLLFGSYARGTSHFDSDYDVLVVSPCFEGIERGRRGLDLWKLQYEAGRVGPVDMFFVTPEEFERARTRPTLIASVLADAIDVLPAA